MLTVQPLDPPVSGKRTERIGHMSREYVICSTYMSLDKSHNRTEFFLKVLRTFRDNFICFRLFILKKKKKL